MNEEHILTPKKGLPIGTKAPNLDFFFQELGIKTKIYRQSEIGLKRKKKDLILEMCEYFNADLFIFGKLGRNYADINLFNEKDIQRAFNRFPPKGHMLKHIKHFENEDLLLIHDELSDLMDKYDYKIPAKYLKI